jgi:hypothetical protein
MIISEPIKVIFRFWENEVIAIIPEEVGDNDPSTCLCYMHIGQHGSCDPDGLMAESRPATPEEYKDLYEEMTSIGYDIKICKKNLSSYYQVRKKTIEVFK